MKIEDIMSENIIVADIDESIYEIANKMREYNIGFMPVGQKKKIIGVITDRDIVVNMVAEKKEKIGDYISKEIIKINSKASIEEALELMGNKKVKRLLIENNNRLVGILSLSDIFNNFDDKFVLDNIKKIFAIYNKDNNIKSNKNFKL